MPFPLEKNWIQLSSFCLHLCGSQHPWWPPVAPTSWSSPLLSSRPFPGWAGLVGYHGWWCETSKTRSWKTLGHSPWDLPFSLGESSNHTVRRLSSPVRGPCGGEPSSLANSHEWIILEKDPPAPVNPSDDCSLSQHLDCYLMRSSARTDQLNCSWILTHKNYEISAYSCCKLLNLGIICYAAVDN